MGRAPLTSVNICYQGKELTIEGRLVRGLAGSFTFGNGGCPPEPQHFEIEKVLDREDNDVEITKTMTPEDFNELEILVLEKFD